MRDFFIGSFEKLVNVLVILMMLGVVIAAFASLVSPMRGGPGGALIILLGGGLYTIIVGGALYMGLGIYQNTKRSAELLERIANKQG